VVRRSVVIYDVLKAPVPYGEKTLFIVIFMYSCFFSQFMQIKVFVFFLSYKFDLIEFFNKLSIKIIISKDDSC
jgi:hypothetical protein